VTTADLRLGRVGAEAPTSPAFTGRAAAAVRRFVTVVVFVIAGLAFAFGFGNGWKLGVQLGVPNWIAPLVAPAVDLSVVALLVTLQYLRVHGVRGRLLGPRLLLGFCGLVTFALNTASPILEEQYGRACFDAVAPLLLIGWSEVGPRLLALVQGTGTEVVPRPSVESEARPPSHREEDLLEAARAADAEYRAAHDGRPITRDALRAALRISGSRATELRRHLRTG
jgi:hypothetical protein